MLKSILISGLCAIPLVLAAPSPCHGITSKDITTIDPTTSSCSDADFPIECATADTAAPNIDHSFHTFKIKDFGTQAALLSIMLFETSGFKYNINHYPGVPGQGTRNMQSPAFNSKYAEWIAANGKDGSITAENVKKAEAEGPKDVLDLINDERWGFASASWFLSTQCEEAIAEGLAAMTEEGWEKYLTECVGTTVTDERTAIWKKAIALGKW